MSCLNIGLQPDCTDDINDIFKRMVFDNVVRYQIRDFDFRIDPILNLIETKQDDNLSIAYLLLQSQGLTNKEAFVFIFKIKCNEYISGFSKVDFCSFCVNFDRHRGFKFLGYNFNIATEFYHRIGESGFNIWLESEESVESYNMKIEISAQSFFENHPECIAKL